MLPELSSNWKKLQAQIKAASTQPAAKHKARDTLESPGSRPKGKRQKVPGPNTDPKAPPAMSVAQSSKIDTVPAIGVAPSLALWAEDNISPEDIAEAYGLDIEGTSLVTAEAARPNEGWAPGIDVGKYVAIDCEMVGVGEDGRQHALARVSVVDFHGRQVYDSFVRPRQRVTNWRTSVSGVTPKHMATARKFDNVRADLANLLKGRVLIGHDVKHDLDVLELQHPAKATRDTARFHGFKKYGNGPRPALRVLAKELLGLEIQSGQHSSIEDARVAMLLFRRHKSAFDADHMARFPASSTSSKGQNQRKKAKKKRKN